LKKGRGRGRRDYSFPDARGIIVERMRAGLSVIIVVGFTIRG